jgi:hypothetical protein
MKKFIKLIPAALALVALASCSQDDLFSKENNQQAVDGKTMVATIEGAEDITRAAFAENKNDAGKADKRALVWTEGDAYKMYGKRATPDKYTLKGGAGKTTGVFEAPLDYDADPAFAVFPYDGVDADRASQKLTVKLGNWTYETAKVNEEGFNQGAFKSVVPMYGQLREDGDVNFGYLTALLRVDLQKLPKRMTRLIVVTDRPLKGTFETEFDPTDKSTYPEIISPVSNDEAKESYDFKVDRDNDGTIAAADAYNNFYFLTVGTESVDERTNKTFFIPVPTGNKYKTFDVLVEYNMGSLKKYEIVAQLGADHGKVLKWQRGKVKSLQREITVTSGGNTPKALSKFLKDEWKTFPADAVINITVSDKNGNPAAIKLTGGGSSNDIFTVPAEIKNRDIRIIFDESITEAYTATNTMYIVDEDAAPVASEPLRRINIIGETAANVILDLQCPETQIVLSAPEGTTAVYDTPAKVLVAGTAGLKIDENVTVGDLTIIGGGVINAGTTGAITNNGDNDVEISGTTTGDIMNRGKGALTIEGTEDTPATIGGDIHNGNGTVTPGLLTIENAVLAGNWVRNYTNADKGVVIKNVDQFSFADKGKGAVSITKVTINLVKATIDNAASVALEDIATAGTVTYTGTGAFTANLIKGAVTEFEATKASEFTVTGIENTIASLKYDGTGAATITGNDGKAPAVTAAAIKGGDVAISNILANTTVSKTAKGTLTITNSKLGTVTNAGGTITATAGAKGKTITTLTQQSGDKVTLDGMNPVTTLNVNAAPVDYNNTFIATLNNTNGGGAASAIYGTKASGVGAATGKITPTTDDWDGTSYSPTLTKNIYTSASLAKLIDGKAGDGNITLYLNLNMNDKAFKKGTAAGIATGNTTFNGGKFTIKNLNGSFYANKPSGLTINQLTLDGVKAANAAIAAETAGAFIANGVTLKNVTLSASKDAGGFIGIAKDNANFTSCTVNTITISSAAAGEGTDINLGGFIGQVNKSSAFVAINGGLVDGATITGHYYVGGFIGQIVDATQVKIVDVNGTKMDKVGSKVKNFTLNAVTKDNNWSTLKCGTHAPFIGGINKLSSLLQIYGEFDVANFNRATCMWNKNFLSNEAYKFIGTKDDNCNFIGYINVANAPAFTYWLKHVNGFEANPSMTIITATDTGKTLDSILSTECNAYASGAY